MIEALEHPPLHAKLIRRGAALGMRMPFPTDAPAAASPTLTGSDIRFFVVAYLGALTFFLAWLS